MGSGAIDRGRFAAVGSRHQSAPARDGARPEPGRRREGGHPGSVPAGALRARGGGSLAGRGAGFRAPDDGRSRRPGAIGGGGDGAARRRAVRLAVRRPRRAGAEACGCRASARGGGGAAVGSGCRASRPRLPSGGDTRRYRTPGGGGGADRGGPGRARCAGCRPRRSGRAADAARGSRAAGGEPHDHPRARARRLRRGAAAAAAPARAGRAGRGSSPGTIVPARRRGRRPAPLGCLRSRRTTHVSAPCSSALPEGRRPPTEPDSCC